MEKTLERTFLYDLCENHTKNRVKVIDDLKKFTKNTKTITKVAGVVIDNPITIKDNAIETLRKTLVKQHAAHLELSEALKNREIQYEGILPLDVFKKLVTEVLFTKNFFCFYNITDEGVVKIGIKDLSNETIGSINKESTHTYSTVNTDVLKDAIWPNFNDIQGVHHNTCSIVLPEAPVDMQKRLITFRKVFPTEQCGLLVHRDAFSIHEIQVYIQYLQSKLDRFCRNRESSYQKKEVTIENRKTKYEQALRSNNDPILFWITNDLVVVLGQYGDIPEEKALMEKFTREYFQVLCREKTPHFNFN